MRHGEAAQSLLQCTALLGGTGTGEEGRRAGDAMYVSLWLLDLHILSGKWIEMSNFIFVYSVCVLTPLHYLVV